MLRLNVCIRTYMIQPVVKPVVKPVGQPVWQPVVQPAWQPVVSCKRSIIVHVEQSAPSSVNGLPAQLVIFVLYTLIDSRNRMLFFRCDFAICWLFSYICSLSNSVINLWQSDYWRFHHARNVSVHYLVQYWGRKATDNLKGVVWTGWAHWRHSVNKLRLNQIKGNSTYRSDQRHGRLQLTNFCFGNTFSCFV